MGFLFISFQLSTHYLPAMKYLHDSHANYNLGHNINDLLRYIIFLLLYHSQQDRSSQ